jgi:DNA-binding transcriptional ArsR family regulator
MNITDASDVAMAGLLGSIADEFTRRARVVRPAKIINPAAIAFEVRERKKNPDLCELREEAWNMLIDLYLARRCPSISSLCGASYGPPTTALRHIAILEDAGLAERVKHIRDGRKTIISITSRGREIMDRHFDGLGRFEG